MRKVFKYPIGISTTLELPKGAEFLSVGTQDQDAFAWFLVDLSQPTEPRKFRIYGTGHTINDDPVTFLGTFQSHPFVWHLFEV